jgi:hypothetical protein
MTNTQTDNEMAPLTELESIFESTLSEIGFFDHMDLDDVIGFCPEAMVSALLKELDRVTGRADDGRSVVSAWWSAYSEARRNCECCNADISPGDDACLVLPEDTSEVPGLMALIELDRVEHGVYPDGRRWISRSSLDRADLTGI